ncbi:neuropeptide Y receptor type 1-like [Haliotis rufescens]|uniref:neuropeptide Y receptor type 1-like n=1 Tax=Haliotis rufescens TaxID=6454 RepID=UPI00201EA15C|nr:neuropeptide Y receptor type 1-like [Haliotis rufescens]
MTSIFDQSVSSLEFLVIAIASIGNVALIVVMLKKKIVQRRPFETCLFSMAFSDLMFVLTTALPFSLYKLLGTWSLGVHICQVHLVGRAVFERISLCTIGFIGIESFRALGNVNGQAFSMGTTRAFIVCVWGFTLASGCPYAAWYVLTDNPDGSKKCHVIFFNSVTLAYTVVMRTLFVIPVVIVIICYTGVICRTVKSHRRRSPTRGYVCKCCCLVQ